MYKGWQIVDKSRVFSCRDFISFNIGEKLQILACSKFWQQMLMSWFHEQFTYCFSLHLHRVSKNVPPSTSYNLDIHDPITMIFGRNVTEKVRNHIMLCFPPHPSSASALLCEIGSQKTAHWCIVRASHSNCCSAIDSLCSEPCSQQTLWLNALITRRRESYSSMIMSRESKRLKKSSSWLNSGNAVIRHLRENATFAFPVLPGSAEARVIWCGIVVSFDCLLYR